tara:strand:- start:4655 stop:5053 length:399 start_codon:yes stop_codon:yes gene_type:complete
MESEQDANNPKRCKAGCGFFATFEDYCSKCYRDKLYYERKNESHVLNIIEEPEKKETICQVISDVKKDHTRCFKCNKKLRTNIMFCKCSNAFCSEHLFYKDHNCSFDFKQHGKSIIKKQNPKIESDSGLYNI